MVSSRKLLTISVLIFLVWLGIGIFLYTSPTLRLPRDDNPMLSQEVLRCKALGEKLPHKFWKTVNLQKEIPESINKSIAKIQVKSDHVTVKGLKVHYLHAVNPKLEMRQDVSVLLLHGKAYNAETWKKLQTIQSIAAFGFYVVAIDLPKHTKGPIVENLDKAEFLNIIISTLNLQNPVIVSPSMSGSYSLKFLLKHSNKLAGFVPVAPVATAILEDSLCRNLDNVYSMTLSEGCEKIKGYLTKPPPDLSCMKVPTMVVYGEKDRGENSAKLCFLPNSQGVEIPNGSHAAYKSNPALWHKLLYNFLSVINETLSCK